jgi:hypothetical protein
VAPPVAASAAPPLDELPAFDPSVTMKGSVVPPPSRPDSVELLRKRTGTPLIGVPIHDPAPAVQAPVAGVIDPLPAAPVAPTPHFLDRRPREAQASAPVVKPPVPRDDSQPRGKRQSGPGADLNISQVWYDEGDQLSGDVDSSGSRSERARKTISPSVTDLSFYDERPRRRWGLLIGIGVFAAIGGTLAFALTRGSSTPPAPVAVVQPSTTAPIDAAPSTIVATEPPPDVPAAPPPSVAVKAPARRPAEVRAAVEPRAAVVSSGPTARRPAPTTSFPIPGSEPARRLPGGSLTPPSTPPPEPVRAPSPPSLTDSPKDPYASNDAPTDGATPDKKAEFFANLGAQQLIGGDTAGAAANFKKATELDVKNVTATSGMGEIALRQGLFGDAIAHLSKAVKLAPKNPKVLTLLGEAYLNSGNSAQAAAQFKKALVLDPDNARARDGYNEASSRVPPPDDESP